MPLLFSRHPFPEATFGLWLIAEEEIFFRSGLPLSPAETTELEPLKGIRRQEWLAVRWLLHQFTGQKIRLPLVKDAFSKPFFPDHDELTCSLSHSHGVVGALLVHGAGCGCDIQVMVDKTTRLAPKFLNQEEAGFVATQSKARQFELVHIFWTAKESLYKAYGLKALDFRAHIRVEPFEWDGRSGTTTGWVEKEAYRQEYRLLFEQKELPDGRGLIWTICMPVNLP
jgi:phosphopantetheinyl transferase